MLKKEAKYKYGHKNCFYYSRYPNTNILYHSLNRIHFTNINPAQQNVNRIHPYF